MPEYDVLLSIPDENNPDYIKVVNGTGKIMLKETFVTQVSFFVIEMSRSLSSS